jgi:predicted DNA-binding transcriptional regulator YafY
MIPQSPAAMKSLLKIAKRAQDDFVAVIEYVDRRGDWSTRKVSPIRFLGQRETAMLATCLGNERPQRFELSRVMSVKLMPASEVLMPEPIEREKGDA